MASNCKFFDEDVVYKINKKKYIDVGLVLENSEYLSSDEDLSDDADYQDWNEKMKKGCIRVAWHPNGAEEVLPEKKVQLCDRSLMPGDVVRRLLRNQEAQLGYCRRTHVTADLQLVGSRHVVAGVDSAELQPLEEFVADVAVFKDSWVGMVKTVKTELTLCCSDGSRCIMSDVDAFDLEDVLDHRERASEFHKYNFYPGQQMCGPSFCFQKANWLRLNKSLDLKRTKKTIRCTVEHVRVVSLGVQWVCRAYSSKESNMEQPESHIAGEDLKKVRTLNIFEPCTLQVGDRNYLVVRDHHSIITLKEWKGRMASKLPLSLPLLDRELSSDASSVTSRSTASSTERDAHSPDRRKKGPYYPTRTRKKKGTSVRRRAMRHSMRDTPAPTPAKSSSERRVMETLVTETKADVVWQDGSLECNILSTSLYPVHHLDNHEFFPGDFVVDCKESNPLEYGVVKRVDHFGRIALVTWLRTYQSGADPPCPEVLSEQEVSVYDIRDHPDFKYRPGACVIRVANSEAEEGAGQVLDVLCSGEVEVAWVDGSVSCAHPQELYRVGEYDSDDLWADDDSFSDEDSWETESEKSLLGLDESCVLEGRVEGDVTADMRERLLSNIEKLRAGMARLEEVLAQNPTLQTCNVMKRLLELYRHCKVLDQLLGTTYFHERHLQSLVEKLRHRGRVNSIQHVADQISRLFSSEEGGGGGPPLRGAEESPAGPVSDPRNLCQQLCNILKSRLLRAHEEAEARLGMPRSESSALLAAEPIEEEAAVGQASPLLAVSPAGEFSMVECVSDCHKYKLSIFQPVDPGAFFRVVKREMKLLKSSLPQGIIIKSFEDRIDLFSLLVAGPERTPYEGGLFLFDLQLPADYPRSPPLCHYVSFCPDRLNPNLYEGGKVCVSLLGTWGGKGTEIWNPQTSNLLQLIVSIQGLILVSEPYYNEAGYERQKGTQLGAENSRRYNEMVILKLVQSMTNILLSPPRVFEQEITRHFEGSATEFTERLEAWLEISTQSSGPAESGRPLPEFPLLPASRGFCLTLRKLLAGFVAALRARDTATPLVSSPPQQEDT